MKVMGEDAAAAASDGSTSSSSVASEDAGSSVEMDRDAARAAGSDDDGDGDGDGDGGTTIATTKRKRSGSSASPSSVASSDASSASSASSSSGAAEKTTTTTARGDGGDDDAGSSRLFQPHRSLGLLTAASPRRRPLALSSAIAIAASPSARLFRSQKGKFHLQPQSFQSSDDAFVTIPIGDRFQILSLSKLNPVLVSRSLPPSAAHHRGGGEGPTAKKSSSSGGSYGGGDEEEMHRAVSDSSLDVTVATHGPKLYGRAVSITLYSRTRPIVCLDAFPFVRNDLGGSKRRRRSRKKNNNNRWGIVDVVPLGKQRVAMTGEKEGRMENALLFAMVCARNDNSSGGDHRGDTTGGGEKGGAEDGRGVRVVGDDSDEESGSDGGGHESESSDDDDDDDDDDDGSGSGDESIPDDEDRAPAKDCYGRVLIVRAARTTLDILKTIDLDGVLGCPDFVPHVGMHPATYVNKILLGGRPAACGNVSSSDDGIDDDDDDDDEEETKKAAGAASSLLLVNVRSGKMIHSFQCLLSEDGKKKKKKKHEGETRHPQIVTTLAQSPAVDTIAVGTSDGSVHLVNTLHDVRLFTLRHGSGRLRSKKMTGDCENNAVSSVSFRTDGNANRQGVAPLAIGTDDGAVSVWDLTPVEDEDTGIVRRTLLARMEGAHHGGVSKLEYLPGEPLLLSTGLASNSVVLHVFDAPDHSGRILRQRRGHTSPPTLLRYLHPGVAGGGLLANASDGTDASSCQILSCGGPGDLSLRMFSTARSNLDREYSQGPGLERKARKLGMVGPEGRAELLLPEIAGLATSEARGRDWGDLVTIHRDHAMAYVWSTKRGSQNGPVLRQPQWNVSAMKSRPPRSANATSLAVSACGNFALVGTAGGVVYKYNLQSGLPRGSFPREAARPAEEEERRRKLGLRFAGDVGRTVRMLEKKLSKGGTTPSDVDLAERDRVGLVEAEARRKSIVDRATHDDAVVGIAVDSLNRTVVTAGADSRLVLWNFVTHMPHKKSPIRLPAPATKLTHVRDSDLAAIAMADFGVAVFDCSSLAIVRYFGGGRCNKQGAPKGSSGHTGPISDLSFGPDGRKLFTSSLDGTIRVWDVPTGLCVDWMSFSSPPTSLTLSPTGEYLATSHVGRLGISLWCDKSFFRMVLLDGTMDEPAKMNEPCPVSECEQEGASDAVSHTAPSILAKKKEADLGDMTDEGELGDGSQPQAKEEGLITLSGLPPAHWKNLFHLELVKERNKPTEAPQKPPQAPFFLQWRSGLESGTNDATDGTKVGGPSSNNDGSEPKDATDGWDAVWSDDDEDNAGAGEDKEDKAEPTMGGSNKPTTQNKRRKVAHHRSKLADLLRDCYNTKAAPAGEVYSDVTSYLSKMGPSSIDVEISSLCYGMHDLDDGLPLLRLASTWLLEACESRQSFEAVNAYLHRFLHVHGNVIARIDSDSKEEAEVPEGLEQEEVGMFIETIARLQEKQRDASNRLQGKMQHTICLLRHLSRMI